MLAKHRRWISIAIPYTFYNTIWWCLAIKHNFFQVRRRFYETVSVYVIDPISADARP
jgi:hypothetical protein